MLVRRVRGEGREVEIPFRCDGPDVRREMDLRIGASSGGRFVIFAARLRAEHPRPAPQPLLSAETRRVGSKLTMCGWCDRFLVDGDWVEVEDAAARLDLFRREALPGLSHGICPDCSRLLLAA
jgi:hypothetical protein